MDAAPKTNTLVITILLAFLAKLISLPTTPILSKAHLWRIISKCQRLPMFSVIRTVSCASSLMNEAADQHCCGKVNIHGAFSLRGPEAKHTSPGRHRDDTVYRRICIVESRHGSACSSPGGEGKGGGDLKE